MGTAQVGRRYRNADGHEVEAAQLTDDLRNQAAIAIWVEANGGHAEIPFAEPCLYIETRDGRMRACIGHLVVKYAKGEFRLWEPHAFEATYEPAEAPRAAESLTAGAAPTQERARGLAAQATALRDAIEAFHADFSACEDEPTRRAGFRLDVAKGWAKEIAGDLSETAADLGRIAAAAAPGTCRIPWGVCPEHGNFLISTGGRSWCKRAGCSRKWDYDRGGLPCTEPAAWTWTAPDGTTQVCEGHAAELRTQVPAQTGHAARLVPVKAAAASDEGH